VHGRPRSQRGAHAAALAAVALPAAGFILLLVAPDLDVRWEDHPSHFWLVVLAAATTAVLAYATGESADRRGDPRLLLISLSFLAASGFLALHALATPGIFLESSNLGFQVAPPVGLMMAAAFAAASALPSTTEGIARMSRGSRRMRTALLALMGAWALATVAAGGLDAVRRPRRIHHLLGGP
jgi:adenylate cyclase